MNIFSQLRNSELSRSAIIVFICRIIGIALYFVFNILISRNFGAAIYGDFNIYILLLNLCSIFALLGLDQIALQRLPALINNEEKTAILNLDQKIQKYLFWSVIGMCLLLCILSLIMTGIFNHPLTILLVTISVGPFVINRYRLEGIRSFQKMGAYGFVAYVCIPLFSTLCFLFLVNKFSELTPFLAYSIGIFMAVLSSQLIWKKLLKRSKNNSEKTHKQAPLFQAALPLMLVAVLLFFNDWIDKLMLRVLSTDVDVGLYSAAFRWIQFFALPLISINAIIAPKLSESWLNSKTSLSSLAQKATGLIVLSSIPLAIIIICFSNYLLAFFGKEFIIANTALIILLIGQVFNVFAGPVGIILKMTQNQDALLKFVFLSVVINLILNLILIPQLGINGAAVGTTMSIIVFNLFCIVFIKRKLGFYSFIPKFTK